MGKYKKRLEWKRLVHKERKLKQTCHKQKATLCSLFPSQPPARKPVAAEEIVLRVKQLKECQFLHNSPLFKRALARIINLCMTATIAILKGLPFSIRRS